MADIRENDLLFAVPKKGRLYDKVIKILEGSGFKFNRTPRLDIAACSNLPVTFIFLPAADIPKYVGQGDVHLGITGKDMIEETEVHVKQNLELGFGYCQLALQVPIAKGIKSPKDLAGGRIVTSFPNLAKKYFERVCPDKQTTINYVSGSVEVACSLGLADAIVDLVETGSTMRAAGLELLDVIMKTEAVLISNPKLQNNQILDKIVRRIEGFVIASRFSMITYNVSKDNLDKAKKITPGKKAPTISPLEDPEWVSVSALVQKDKSADIMDQLDLVGATDILLSDMTNCRV